MNRNQLKIIACISMLIDHVGYVLFPDAVILRLIGRIAMPIFAFFIGEGCLYTKNKKKYFLRVFILGLLCQAVYITESLITHSDGGAYLNILLTFSLSIILCSSYLSAVSAFRSDDKKQRIKGLSLFALCLIVIGAVCLFCEHSLALTGISIEFDYGICGICLPLFAALSKDKTKKLICFSLALTFSAFTLYNDILFSFCALIPLALLIFYNGKGGKANLKYFFYAFYPCHLALIYLVDIFI